MDITKTLALSLSIISSFAFGHGDDDPLLTKMIIDKFEYTKDRISILENDFWIGKDLKKLWIKSDWEKTNGKFRSTELQALYNQAISANWDLQLGLRHDFAVDFDDDQNWAAIGLRGLAPYFFDIDTTLFLTAHGDVAFRFKAEYELRLSQRWTLIPEFAVDIYGQDNEKRGIGSGLSETELGLRLAYFYRREIAPYFGYSWDRSFQGTADFSIARGENVRNSSWVAGVKFWF